jgi:hypothetical protein
MSGEASEIQVRRSRLKNSMKNWSLNTVVEATRYLELPPTESNSNLQLINGNMLDELLRRPPNSGHDLRASRYKLSEDCKRPQRDAERQYIMAFVKTKRSEDLPHSHHILRDSRHVDQWTWPFWREEAAAIPRQRWLGGFDGESHTLRGAFTSSPKGGQKKIVKTQRSHLAKEPTPYLAQARC